MKQLSTKFKKFVYLLPFLLFLSCEKNSIYDEKPLQSKPLPLEFSSLEIPISIDTLQQLRSDSNFVHLVHLWSPQTTRAVLDTIPKENDETRLNALLQLLKSRISALDRFIANRYGVEKERYVIYQYIKYELDMSDSNLNHKTTKSIHIDGSVSGDNTIFYENINHFIFMVWHDIHDRQCGNCIINHSYGFLLDQYAEILQEYMYNYSGPVSVIRRHSNNMRMYIESGTLTQGFTGDFTWSGFFSAYDNARILATAIHDSLCGDFDPRSEPTNFGGPTYPPKPPKEEIEEKELCPICKSPNCRGCINIHEECAICKKCITVQVQQQSRSTTHQENPLCNSCNNLLHSMGSPYIRTYVAEESALSIQQLEFIAAALIEMGENEIVRKIMIYKNKMVISQTGLNAFDSNTGEIFLDAATLEIAAITAETLCHEMFHKFQYQNGEYTNILQYQGKRSAHAEIEARVFTTICVNELQNSCPGMRDVLMNEYFGGHLYYEATNELYNMLQLSDGTLRSGVTEVQFNTAYQRALDGLRLIDEDFGVNKSMPISEKFQQLRNLLQSKN